MDKILWIIMAFMAGAILPFQAGLNTKMGKIVESPGYATLISFVVGILGLLIYLLVSRQTVSWAGLKDAPIHVWLGGLLGAFYVMTIIYAFPKLGPGLTFGLVVAGQMIFSVVLEHNNILVAQQSPVNVMKLLGIGLIIVGVVIIRKY